MAKPTIPEIPSQNQRSNPAFRGRGDPKMNQWIKPSNIMATTSLRRLETSGPNFLPANVKNIDEIE
jgi:hypothetical protein